jgi:hypothetical protein
MTPRPGLSRQICGSPAWRTLRGVPQPQENLACPVTRSSPLRPMAQVEEPGLRRGEAGGRGGLGSLTDVIKHEDRLRRAKYLGALADRLFRDECTRLGLNADDDPLSRILSFGSSDAVSLGRQAADHHKTFGRSGHTKSQRSCNRESRPSGPPDRKIAPLAGQKIRRERTTLGLAVGPISDYGTANCSAFTPAASSWQRLPWLPLHPFHRSRSACRRALEDQRGYGAGITPPWVDRVPACRRPLSAHG